MDINNIGESAKEIIEVATHFKYTSNLFILLLLKVPLKCSERVFRRVSLNAPPPSIPLHPHESTQTDRDGGG